MRPMTSMFHRSDHSMPALNLASMPDLIFTVLFFFMIVTHMRDTEVKVRYQVPAGTEIEKLTHKQSVAYIYIGMPLDGSDQYQLQLNNHIATVADIANFVSEERSHLNDDDQQRFTVSIKADRRVPMRLINEVKQALQQQHVTRINYSANELRVEE